MARAPLSYADAHAILLRARAADRVELFSDPAVLNRPGSPVFSPLDVYVPPVVLLASSLTLLFAVGLIAWLVALVLVLGYQMYLARRVVEWRLHRRTVRAAFAGPQNFALLWNLGGIAIALKGWPERNCVAPAGDWRKFVADYLDTDAPAPSATVD